MTFEKIAKVIAENRGIEVDTIKAETSFEELGFDSLDVVELAMTLEEDFGITIEVSGDFKTIGDVVTYIDGLK